MSIEIDIPNEIPVMTLEDVVLFPQAMMPLHIYEGRYQQMLEDILDSHRLLIIANEDHDLAETTGQFEPPHQIASVGIVRASHQADDGTSNLIIQGLVRVRFLSIIKEEPYRVAQVEVLESNPGSHEDELRKQQAALTRLFDVHLRLGGIIPAELMNFLDDLDDPETFLDLAAFTLCSEQDEKQRLLETLNTAKRFGEFIEYFRSKNKKLILEKKLRGGLDDDQISMN